MKKMLKALFTREMQIQTIPRYDLISDKNDYDQKF